MATEPIPPTGMTGAIGSPADLNALHERYWAKRSVRLNELLAKKPVIEITARREERKQPTPGWP